MSKIGVCNPSFRNFGPRIFRRVFAMKLIAEWVCQKSVGVTEKFRKFDCIGRCPEGRANANESQHRIRHEYPYHQHGHLTIRQFYAMQFMSYVLCLMSYVLCLMSYVLGFVYHNFIVRTIRVSPSVFLFVPCSNYFHGVYVLHTADCGE